MNRTTSSIEEILAAVATALVVGGMYVPVAHADPAPGVCENYADQAVAQGRQNTQHGCNYGGPRWTAGWTEHFNWCKIVSDADRQNEFNERKRLLDLCLTSR
jgi:hypothetical protein